MLDTPTLHDILLHIYGIEPEYLVPLDTDWYVPTYDKNNHVGTWIGYRILMVKPNVRANYTGSSYNKSIKGRFRLSFIGKQAESLALATLLFDDRKDVIEEFARHGIQVNYTSREILTYPLKEGGLNNSLVWFTDIECQSFYAADVKYDRWTDAAPPEPQPWIPKHAGTGEDGRLHSGTLIIHT